MSGRDELEAFLAQARGDPEGTLIALDVDGTVSAIVSTPDEALVEPEVRATLERVAQRYRVWFLSGRDADRAREIVGVREAGYVGAHGLEALDGDTLRTLAPLEDLSVQLDALAAAVAHDLPEAAPYIKRKRWSVAFHYRAAPEIAALLEERIEARVTPALRLHAGKMVYEVGPAIEHDKGTALAWLIETFHPRRVLVAGDDLTDVGMFRTLAEERARGGVEGIGVAVLQPGETPAEVLDAADTAVDGVAGLQRVLLSLLTAVL